MLRLKLIDPLGEHDDVVVDGPFPDTPRRRYWASEMLRIFRAIAEVDRDVVWNLVVEEVSSCGACRRPKKARS